MFNFTFQKNYKNFLCKKFRNYNKKVQKGKSGLGLINLPHLIKKKKSGLGWSHVDTLIFCFYILLSNNKLICIYKTISKLNLKYNYYKFI